jgi:ribosome recycling factor
MVALNSNNIKIRMDKAIESFKKDLSSLRVGRASSTMLDTININAYGSVMPLNQISTVSVPESRLLLVSVWDNSLVAITEKCIRESPLGLNPMVEGNVIRLSVPPLSEDRRVEIAKVASKYSENDKIALRNIIRDLIENIRKLQKNSEISEDQKHQDEALVQEITDEFIKNIDIILSNKEKEILEN